MILKSAKSPGENVEGGRRVPVSDLNSHLICSLCKGYFIDATTIIECLHSFCRSCIVKYLETNKYCPVCDVQVHKNKPLTNIRPDKILQDIVYKLVPKLYQNELQRRHQFYTDHPEAKPSSLELKSEATYQYLLTPEETVCISMKYHGSKIPPRYLRCPAAVRMTHLKKLIRAKYSLTDNHKVEVLHNQDTLNEQWSVMDIAYIYMWRQKGPLELTYRIYENMRQGLTKASASNDSTPNNNSITTPSAAGNTNNNDWKEVQLQISENGVISVTGIQDCQDLLDKLPVTPVATEASASVVAAGSGAGDVRQPTDTAKVSKTTGEAKTPKEKKKRKKSVKEKKIPPLKIVGLSNNKNAICDPNNSGGAAVVPKTSPKFTVQENIVFVNKKLETKKGGEDSTKDLQDVSKKLQEASKHENKATETNDVKRKLDNGSASEKPSKIQKVETGDVSKTINKSESQKCIQSDTPKVEASQTAEATKSQMSKPVVSNAITSVSKDIKQCSESIKIVDPKSVDIVAKSDKSLNNCNKPDTVKTEVAVKSEVEAKQTNVDIAKEETPKTNADTKQLSKVNTNTNKQSDLLIPVTNVESTKTTVCKSETKPPTTDSKQPSAKLNHSTVVSSTFTRPTPTVIPSTASFPSVTNAVNNRPSTPALPAKCTYVSKSQMYVPPPVLSSSPRPVAPPPTLAHKPGGLNSPTTAPVPKVSAKNATMGYKTLRDPPKTWNPQISRSSLQPTLKSDDNKPPKFFKIRNNMPRYLGNPASGVKPMYSVPASPEKDKSSSQSQKRSIVKLDPKTLKPISESTSLATSSATTAPTPATSDLKINTSSVPIFNPLKLQSSPKGDRKSPKSPISKTENKPNLNFTPPNPFIPNLSSPTMSPHPYIYSQYPDPRVIAAYHSLLYGQQLSYNPAMMMDMQRKQYAAAAAAATASTTVATTTNTITTPSIGPPPAKRLKEATSGTSTKPEKSLQSAVDKLNKIKQSETKTTNSSSNNTTDSGSSNDKSNVQTNNENVAKGNNTVTNSTSVDKDASNNNKLEMSKASAEHEGNCAKAEPKVL